MRVSGVRLRLVRPGPVCGSRRKSAPFGNGERSLTRPCPHHSSRNRVRGASPEGPLFRPATRPVYGDATGSAVGPPTRDVKSHRNIKGGGGVSMTGFIAWRASALSVLLFLLFIGVWHAATLPAVAQQSVDSEYAKLVGAAAASGQKSAFP